MMDSQESYIKSNGLKKFFTNFIPLTRTRSETHTELSLHYCQTIQYFFTWVFHSCQINYRNILIFLEFATANSRRDRPNEECNCSWDNQPCSERREGCYSI